MIRASLFPMFLISMLMANPARCGEFQVRRPSGRVLVIQGPEAAGEKNNVVALATERGLVVIDTNSSPSIMREEREIIEKEFGRKDFRHVISTHHHYDHVQGNPVFPKTLIIAHEQCPAAMQAADGFAAESASHKMVRGWPRRGRSCLIAAPGPEGRRGRLRGDSRRVGEGTAGR